jgi:F-type H+-transporting ATPase subunit b
MDNPLLKSLNIAPEAILINIVGFVLLLFVLRAWVFIPIGNLLTERDKDISDTYDKIDADKKAMEATRDDYQRRLAAIEEERRETVQRAINEAQATRDQIIHEAQARAQEMVKRAEQDVAHEREQAMITLRGDVVNLALGATAKLIGTGLDDARQRKLIDDFINAGTAPNVPSAAGAR